MKRVVQISMIVLILAMTACSSSGPKPAAAPGEPAATKAAASDEVSPTKAPEKVELATPTAAPTETASGSAAYSDSFDEENSNWSSPVVVTSQAAGRDAFVKVSLDSGNMRFAISDKETYVYRLYLYPIDSAATMTVNYQNKGAINTGIAIVCKANKDLTSWYEVRMSASDNNYNFYQYDKKRRDEEGKNPYVLLGKGHMKVEEYYPTRPNLIKLTCSDTEMTLDINKGKKTATQTLENKPNGDLFGLGVLSADVLPGTIDFDSVSIEKAK